MHRESFSPRHGRHDPEPADGNSPLWQVLAAPRGDAGPLTCGRRRTRMPWRIPGWAKYGAATRSPVHPRENLKVVSFAANSRATMAIWGAGVGAPPRLPLARPSGKSFTIIVAISGIPAVSVFAQRAGWLANGCSQPPRYGPALGSRAAPRHDRHGPNPRPPAQIRSNVPRGATRSSTAGYFILHRIKVT
jgi:hypothetical protein